MSLHRKILLTIAFALALLMALPAFAVGKDNALPIAGASTEFVFKYLIGEIAAQRGDPVLAGNLFLELAKSSRDPRLAERATRAALYANQLQLALRAGSLWAELAQNSVEANQTITQLLVTMGKLNDAKPYMQKLLAAEDTRANGFLYLNGLFSHTSDKTAVLRLVQE